MERSSMLLRGVGAGVVGGIAMAAWFLIIDASQGVPFRTPAFLAGALLGTEGPSATPGPIALFTVIHLAAFGLVGAAMAWLVSRLPVDPGSLMGLVLGFLLFDLVFYTSVSVTGVDVVRELGWPEVLVGNLLAGWVVIKALQVAGASPATSWWRTLEQHDAVREGLVAGVLGAAAVAVWFLFFDLMRGGVLFTPAALGSALFLGASSVAEVQIGPATVLGYTGVHLAAFIVAGLLAAGVARSAEEHPPILLGGLVLFVAFEAFFLALLALVAEFLLGPLAWWTIAVGNLLATVVMGGYLLKRHPAIRRVLDTGDGLFSPTNGVPPQERTNPAG